MRFIDLNANFSANNIGNSNKYQQFVQTAGLTNASQINALKNLEAGLKNNGLWNDFAGIYLFGFGTALADSLNLKNPVTGTAAGQMTWVSDQASYHTTGANGGYAGGTGHWGVTNILFPVDLTNLHMHVYNETPENNAANGTFAFMGRRNVDGASTGGVNHDVLIARNYYSTRFTVAPSTGGTGNTAGAAGTYDKTRLGLLSGWKVGTALTLTDAAASIGTSTIGGTAIVGGGSNPIVVGSYGPASVSGQETNATLRCALFGFTVWTQAKENLLKPLIDNFRTQMVA